MLEKKFDGLMESFSITGNKIAVAVSGGADSTALSVLLSNWAKKNGKELIALIVNHNIRKEAEKEAELTSSRLTKLKIKNEILTFRGEKKQTGLMEFAREIRYQILISWCKKNKVKTLFVAHNMEDQAETILIRLGRGTGLSGLAGILPESEALGIKILRPLISVHRTEIEKLLKDKKIKWVDDPTNKKLEFKRNHLRFLFEYAGAEKDLLVERIADMAKHVQRARGFIDGETAKALKKTVNFSKGMAVLDLDIFRKTHKEIALRLLSEVLKTIGGKAETPRFDNLERLYNQMVIVGFKGATLSGVMLKPSKKLREAGKIIFEKERKRP